MSLEMHAPQSTPPIKRRFLLRALGGLALICAGLLMVLPHPHHERNFLIEAGGCRLQTAVYEPAGEHGDGSAAPDGRGTVVLLHGLAANRKLMSYLAEGFALQGLRVFVPDLPGHGRTEGPFSAARAEECSENLLHELRSRGLAPPERTILAGHSMGAAMAIRVGARVPVAGVIAISPAPMRAAHGATPEVLLYENPPALPPNTEIINGGLEPQQMTGNSRDLRRPERDNNSHYDVVPWATHAGLLWRPAVVRLEQDWAAKTLGLDGQSFSAPAGTSSDGVPATEYQPPLRWPLAGCLLGLVGFFFIAGPFLREATATQTTASEVLAAGSDTHAPPWWRASLEILASGIAVACLLRYWAPLRLVRLFEGDYLAGFLLFTGLLLIALHWKQFLPIFEFRNTVVLRAVFAAFVLFLLFSAWFELSLTEAWLDAARWQRFPLLCLALIPCFIAEEILLGPPTQQSGAKRLALAMFFRLLLWLTMVVGILFLYSGEILLVLLSPYFAILCLAQRRAMDIVREGTSSPAAAALFGAILLAGFCLVIFPLL
jgi:pimeloyl-ACP methyl ester carboxylesterase